MKFKSLSSSMIVIVCSASLIGLSGCATDPKNISASYVSPIQYDGYKCPQIQEEAARLSAKAVEITGVQQSKASGDAVAMGVGMVLFWPSLFFIKGDGTTASELAHLKGQMNALEEASIKKKCNIKFDKDEKSTES